MAFIRHAGIALMMPSVYTLFGFATLQVIVALVGYKFDSLSRRMWFRTLETAAVTGLTLSTFALLPLVWYIWSSTSSGAADILAHPKFENRVIANKNS